MEAAAKQTNWTEILALFSKQNQMRPTRLGVFEGEAGDMRDYWLADGLPLIGIDVDTRREGAPAIEIMLGVIESDGSTAMTHVINGARSIKIVLSPDGNDDGLEIVGEDGTTTFMRFEN